MHEGSNPSKTGNIAWHWMSGSLLPNSQKETLVQGAKWGRRKGIHNKVRVWGCVQDIQAALKGFGLSPAAAKSLQSCPTLCDPIDGGPPGSPSLGFSRQEHWSGLPFPSPVHEREKWKWSRSVVSDSLQPHGLQPTRLLCPWDFPGKSTGVGCHCLLQIIT